MKGTSEIGVEKRLGKVRAIGLTGWVIVGRASSVISGGIRVEMRPRVPWVVCGWLTLGLSLMMMGPRNEVADYFLWVGSVLWMASVFLAIGGFSRKGVLHPVLLILACLAVLALRWSMEPILEKWGDSLERDVRESGGKRTLLDKF